MCKTSSFYTIAGAFKTVVMQLLLMIYSRGTSNSGLKRLFHFKRRLLGFAVHVTLQYAKKAQKVMYWNLYDRMSWFKESLKIRRGDILHLFLMLWDLVSNVLRGVAWAMKSEIETVLNRNVLTLNRLFLRCRFKGDLFAFLGSIKCLLPRSTVNPHGLTTKGVELRGKTDSAPVNPRKSIHPLLHHISWFKFDEIWDVSSEIRLANANVDAPAECQASKMKVVQRSGRGKVEGASPRAARAANVAGGPPGGAARRGRLEGNCEQPQEPANRHEPGSLPDWRNFLLTLLPPHSQLVTSPKTKTVGSVRRL